MFFEFVVLSKEISKCLKVVSAGREWGVSKKKKKGETPKMDAL